MLAVSACPRRDCMPRRSFRTWDAFKPRNARCVLVIQERAAEKRSSHRAEQSRWPRRRRAPPSSERRRFGAAVRFCGSARTASEAPAALLPAFTSALAGTGKCWSGNGFIDTSSASGEMIAMPNLCCAFRTAWVLLRTACCVAMSAATLLWTVFETRPPLSLIKEASSDWLIEPPPTPLVSEPSTGYLNEILDLQDIQQLAQESEPFLHDPG